MNEKASVSKELNAKHKKVLSFSPKSLLFSLLDDDLCGYRTKIPSLNFGSLGKGNFEIPFFFSFAFIGTRLFIDLGFSTRGSVDEKFDLELRNFIGVSIMGFDFRFFITKL